MPLIRNVHIFGVYLLGTGDSYLQYFFFIGKLRNFHDLKKKKKKINCPGQCSKKMSGENDSAILPRDTLQ